MKKLIRRTLIFVLILFPLIIGLTLLCVNGVKSEDSKEVVILKLEKALEAQARIRAELQLMQYRFKEGQEALTIVDKEVKDLQGKLKAMESKKEEKPKTEEKK